MKKVIIFVLLLLTIIYPNGVVFAQEDNQNTNTQESTKSNKNNDDSTSLDTNTDNNEENSNVELISNALSGILIEANSGKIIFEKEKDKQVAVASMTKMVAQIIILENIEKGNIKWDQEVTVSKNAADMGGSQIYISEGEKITVRDLMKGISMASGNDATVQMAEVISGSEANFVKLMNKKVKELGLKNTVFKNATGLDEDGHFSTAYDMAMIARELVVNHPQILEFSSVYEDYLREDTDNKFWLVNTNKLVRYYEGADGLKTGHTDAAKYCLAATAKKNNLRLIGIVLGEENSKTRNSEAMALLDYGFNSVKFNTLKKKGEVVKKVKLDKANVEEVNLVLGEDLGVMEEKTATKHKYTYQVKVDDIKLPLKKGTIVGKVIVKENKKEVSSSNLVISRNVNNISYFNLVIDGLKNIISGRL